MKRANTVRVRLPFSVERWSQGVGPAQVSPMLGGRQGIVSGTDVTAVLAIFLHAPSGQLRLIPSASQADIFRSHKERASASLYSPYTDRHCSGVVI